MHSQTLAFNWYVLPSIGPFVTMCVLCYISLWWQHERYMVITTGTCKCTCSHIRDSTSLEMDVEEIKMGIIGLLVCMWRHHLLLPSCLFDFLLVIGYIYIGRVDDVINPSGHRIGESLVLVSYHWLFFYDQWWCTRVCDIYVFTVYYILNCRYCGSWILFSFRQSGTY